MTSIGFSTGALAFSDFHRGLQLLAETKATAVELSALRQSELTPLLDSIANLDLRQFRHISVHLPSSIQANFESSMLGMLDAVPADWLLITHPNIISEWDRWRELGPRVCIENMDKRKPVGQTAKDLRNIFAELPEATFCLDLGHAHQVDPTMGEAVLIIEEFRPRLRQLHISEVNSESKHDAISLESEMAFSVVAHLIPERVPVILESRISPLDKTTIEAEMDFASEMLTATVNLPLAGD